jgi:hypothetical protein
MTLTEVYTPKKYRIAPLLRHEVIIHHPHGDADVGEAGDAWDASPGGADGLWCMTRDVVCQTGNGCCPPMAGHAGFRFPRARMSISSQERSDDPSAPTCFAHQSMPIKAVAARCASVVRTTAGHPRRVAAG